MISALASGLSPDSNSSYSANGFAGSVELEAGNYGAIEVKGMVNIPLGETLAARFAGISFKRDGYTDNLATGNDIDDRDQWSARGALDRSLPQFAGTPEVYDPEFVNAFEVGSKDVLAGGRVQANLTAFYYQYDALQVSKIVRALRSTRTWMRTSTGWKASSCSARRAIC